MDVVSTSARSKIQLTPEEIEGMRAAEAGTEKEERTDGHACAVAFWRHRRDVRALRNLSRVVEESGGIEDAFVSSDGPALDTARAIYGAAYPYDDDSCEFWEDVKRVVATDVDLNSNAWLCGFVDGSIDLLEAFDRQS